MKNLNQIPDTDIFTKSKLLNSDFELTKSTITFFVDEDSYFELKVDFTAKIENYTCEDKHGFKGGLTDIYCEQWAFVDENEPLTAELFGHSYELSNSERNAIIEIINENLSNYIFNEDY